MLLKTKFIILGGVLITVVSATEWLNYKNSSLANQQQVSVEIVQKHMDSDMKHDGIRGNVYSTLVALRNGDMELLKSSREEVQSMASEFSKNVDECISADIPAEIKQQFQKIKSSVANYASTSQQITSNNNYEQAIGMLAQFNNVFKVLEENQGRATDMILSWSAGLHASSEAIASYLSYSMAALMLIALGLPMFSIMAIFNPQQRMMGAMQAIAGGNAQTQIPYTQRKDEIGALSRTAEIFKNNLLEIEKMGAEREAQKAEAEKQKRIAMHEMANSFESSVKGIVNAVAAAATQLAQTSEELVKTMTETSVTTQSAVSGATQTAANVQSVASAAEEMTASVKEISSQLQNSNDMVQESVKRTESADAKAASLTHATNKVKDVINLISDISGQINLLALNATIESARAGEAGKGFAVVASEVKNLANQTDKSVQEISSVIEEMNLASDEIVDSLKGIKESVEHISGASSTIAAAVEEQSATTNEIARNMQSAAQGTQVISSNLDTVSHSTHHAEESSSQVLEASKELSKQAEHLSNEVNQFLSTIRAS